MPKELKWFIKKELLLKDETIKNLANNYTEKARSNIITMELLSKVKNFREVLEGNEKFCSECGRALVEANKK